MMKFNTGDKVRQVMFSNGQYCYHSLTDQELTVDDYVNGYVMAHPVHYAELDKHARPFTEDELELIAAVVSEPLPVKEVRVKRKENDKLFLAYARFDNDNPNVYEEFKRNCFRAMNSGHETISPRTVVEHIRWENPGTAINNNHVRFYAERFVRQYPQHDAFFSLKGAKA
jgi:hypothetical protein